MLTIDVGHNFAPDPALPARDLLLDADRVRERLAATMGSNGPLDVGGCDLVRAKYRIGESLRVVYRIQLADGPRLVTGRSFRGGASGPAYRRAAATAVRTDDLHPLRHDADLDTVWWTFPNDRRLRGGETLLRPTPELAAKVGAPTWRASEVVEYAPERSVTLRALDHDHATVGYAKAYSTTVASVSALSRRYRRISAALDRSTVAVSSPTSLGFAADPLVLLLQPMPGKRWDEVGDDDLLSALSRLGAAIAVLHGSVGAPGLFDAQHARPAPAGPADLLPRFARLDVGRVVHSAELIAAARPDVDSQAARLARRLSDGPVQTAQPVLLHGDCHPKNILFDRDRVSLLDLDQSGLGPAAADLGSLIARLRHGAVLGEHADGAADELASAFLSGYARVRPLPTPAALRWHTAAALVAERALRAVNRVHLPALERLGCLLDAAERSLVTGGRP